MFAANQAIADAEQYVPAYVLCCWLEGKLYLAGPTLQGLSDLTSLSLVERAPRDFTKWMRGCWRMPDGRMFELRFEQDKGGDHAHVEVLVAGTRVLQSLMGGSAIDPLPMDLCYRLAPGGMAVLRSDAGKSDRGLARRSASFVSLDRESELILRSIAADKHRLLSVAEIAAEELLQQTLLHRPKGPRKGTTVTPEGEAFLGR
jgi:hypothetical protein